MALAHRDRRRQFVGRPLARDPKDDQRRDHRQQPQDHAGDGEAHLQVGDVPAEHRRQDDRAQRAGDGEGHPVAVERAAFVVVRRHLRGQRVVADMHQGEDGVEQDEHEGVIQRQPGLAERRHEPHQHEGQPQRHRAEQEQHPAPAPARADAIRDQAEQRIVDRVPDPGDPHRPGRIRRIQAGHVGEEEELEEHQDGERDARAEVTDAEKQLAAPRQVIGDGGGCGMLIPLKRS